MSDELPQKGTNTTLLVDIGIIVVVALVALMAILPATRQFAIALGIGVPWGVGLIAAGVALVGGLLAFLGRSKSEVDFSSLPPNEERMFVGHEKTMRANTGRANLIGFGLAGCAFVLGLAVTLGMYTPCTQFCDHAPPTCKEGAITQWKASCEQQCGGLEHQMGLQLLKVAASQEADVKEKRLEMVSVSGTEYVQALAACSFAGGNGATCEKVVEKATSMGLWCPEK